MHVRLQVSWHRGVRFLAVSTPSPWYQTPTPRGGVRGGTPNTKSTYLVTGDPTRADVGKHQGETSGELAPRSRDKRGTNGQ